MKMIDKYQSVGVSTKNASFEYLLTNFKQSIRTHNFFVAWEKVFANVAQIEISLNILNSLIGKENIANELKNLIKSYPEIVPIIPILIAVREAHIVVADFTGELEYSFLKRTKYSDEEIDKIVSFAEKCGLLKALASRKIKNLVDYVLGVEVGLDTNARKNRSGATMESLIEFYVKNICQKYNFKYLAQATAIKIKNVFNQEIPTDQADRHFDFAIDTGHKIYLLEVNYYSSGGSKLKAVAGEFINLFELVRSDKIGFIWITDGLGWNTSKKQLFEAFNAIDYILNIKMIEEGFFEEIITKGL